MSGKTARVRQWRIMRLRKRDGFHCWLCGQGFTGKSALGPVTIDHAIPKGRGGTNHLHNLRLAHQRCNQDRGMIEQTPPRTAMLRALNLTTRMTVLELTSEMELKLAA